jgi:hypothetical protein
MGYEDMLYGMQSGGLAGLANAAGQSFVNYKNDKASDKMARNSLIGTGLSLVGMMAFGSSEKIKDKVDTNVKLLDKLKNVRVDKWRYKGDTAEHIGPYAEEFNQAFGTSRTDTISVIDAVGVALGAVKELNEKLEARRG